MDFMVGNGSYLYFMSLLIFFFIFFYKLKSSSIAVVMSITFSVIYILLASENSMNPYLNPLNFMMYFSLGILLAKYDLFETLIKKSKSHRTYIILSYTLFILLLTNKSIVIHYWDPLIIPLQMFSLLAIFSVINYFKDAKIMRDIGKATLYIYLLHMPFAGIMSHVILYVDNYVLTIIAPLIIVFTTYYVIVVFRKYTKMVNCIK